jgi:putative oxidoreductase
MNAPANLATALGRILIALIFILGGIGKLGAPARTVAEMASHGVPLANILVWGVVAVELGGGLLLVAGLFARCVALALFFYTLVLAVMFHAYWAMPAAQQGVQHAAFYEHLAMAGGMLFVVVFGAGGWSLDAMLRRRSLPSSTCLAAAVSLP